MWGGSSHAGPSSGPPAHVIDPMNKHAREDDELFVYVMLSSRATMGVRLISPSVKIHVIEPWHIFFWDFNLLLKLLAL